MESSSSPIETRVDANQRLVSFSAVTGSFLLALQHVVVESHGPNWLRIPVTLGSAGAWILFLYALWQNQRLFKTPAGEAFKAQLLGDELLQGIQKEAFAWGFAGMLLMQVVFIIAFSFFEPHFLTIPVAATSTMAAGICTAVLRYQNQWSR